MGRNITLSDQGTLVLKELASNGTDSVTVQAPASLAASYTLTLPTTDGGVNEFLQTDGSGGLTWATSTATLQSAYDNGAKIDADGTVVEIEVAAAQGNTALLIDQDDDQKALDITKDGTGAGDAVAILNSGTGRGLFIDQDGAAKAIEIDLDGNANALDINVVATSTNDAITLLNAGTGKGIFVNQDGAAIGVDIDQDGAAIALQVNQATANVAVDVTQQAAAAALNITAGTAAGLVLSQANDNRMLSLTKTGTGAGEGVYIENDGTGDGLHINQDGAGIALDIDIDAASTVDGVLITNNGTGNAVAIVSSATATDACLDLTQSGAAAALDINKLHTGANTAADIRNEGTGRCLKLDQNGNGISLDIDSEATSEPLIELQPLASTNSRGDIAFTSRTAPASAPLEGDIWYDQTNHRFEMDVGSPAEATGRVVVCSRFGPGFGDAETKTIATGAATVTSGHLILAAETGTADTLDTLAVTGAGPKEGDTIVIRADSGDTITVSDGTGNIKLNGAANFVLNSVNDNIMLMWDAGTSQWIEISSSNNAA